MLLVLFPLLINNFILPSHWLIIILFYLWVYVCQAWKMYGCYYLYPCIFWADLTSLSLVLRGRSHIMLYFSFYIVAILLWTQQVGQLCMPAHIKICRKKFLSFSLSLSGNCSEQIMHIKHPLWPLKQENVSALGMRIFLAISNSCHLWGSLSLPQTPIPTWNDVALCATQ